MYYNFSGSYNNICVHYSFILIIFMYTYTQDKYVGMYTIQAHCPFSDNHTPVHYDLHNLMMVLVGV